VRGPLIKLLEKGFKGAGLEPFGSAPSSFYFLRFLYGP